MSTRRRTPEILSALVMLGMLLAMIPHIRAQARDTGAGRNTILPFAQASALHTIQILVGHHDLKETAIYLHLSQRHLHATASPLDALVLKSRSQLDR